MTHFIDTFNFILNTLVWGGIIVSAIAILIAVVTAIFTVVGWLAEYFRWDANTALGAVFFVFAIIFASAVLAGNVPLL